MTSGARRDTASWREGLEGVRRRVLDLPGRLRSFEFGKRTLAVDPKSVRRFVVTGIGSSAGHARYLAEILSRYLGLPASFVSTGRLARLPRTACQQDVLIVFSQGLSPNARFALTAPESWAEVVLFSALRLEDAGQAGSPVWAERREFLRALEAAGVRVMPFLGEDEYGTLVRVSGPLLGYAAALDFARGVACAGRLPEALPEWDVEAIVSRMSAAERCVEEHFPSGTSLEAALRPGLTLLASGGYGEMIENLRTKVQEGLRLPLPALFDVLEFAHGGFQQLAGSEAAVLALVPGDCDDEGVRRASRILGVDRHPLRVLRSPLHGPLAVFEHEAYFNHLLLRWIEETGDDPREWPGKGEDGPLYDWGPAEPSSAGPDEPADRGQRLGEMTWPDVERCLANPETTAVIALGSTEQHGAHLPLSTDSLIAQALTDRFCARIDEAIALPVVEIGIAPEHMDFPGTLSIREETLQAILVDLLASLSNHGFASAFIFSGHGGNVGPLERMTSTLRDAADGIEVFVFEGWEDVVKRCLAAAGRQGVSAEQAGHHGGEIETSIVSAVRPAMVRRKRIEAGLLVGPSEAKAVFSPGMRDRVPNGVVGDPTGACAKRGNGYLECWVDSLVEAYRGEKKRSQMTGMKKA